jgi:hypothetical protein
MGHNLGISPGLVIATHLADPPPNGLPKYLEQSTAC